MTDATVANPAAVPTSAQPGRTGRNALPLWVAAVSLAVIAVVMIVGSIELIHAIRSTQTAVVQLQQQVGQLKSGLGGLLGG